MSEQTGIEMCGNDQFDRWARRYEKGPMWRVFYKTIHRRFIRALKPQPGEKTLDVGCGTGAVARRIAARGADVTGADTSREMIKVARHLSADYPALSFVEAGAESLPFGPASFDCVTSTFAFHHFTNPSACLAELERVIKPGGRIFICDATSDGVLSRYILRLVHGALERRRIHVHAENDRYYRRKEMKSLVAGAGFREVRAPLVCILPWVVVVSGKK